jgi:hypothetical protein
MSAMATSDDDFDKLMAETERMLGGSPAKATPGKAPGSSAPARRQESGAERPPGRIEASVRTSVVTGMVAAGLVWVAFFIAPFLHPTSGAAGAFVATFVIVLVQRITGGRRR